MKDTPLLEQSLNFTTNIVTFKHINYIMLEFINILNYNKYKFIYNKIKGRY